MKLNKAIKRKIIQNVIEATDIGDRRKKSNKDLQKTLRDLALDACSGKGSAQSYIEARDNLDRLHKRAIKEHGSRGIQYCSFLHTNSHVRLHIDGLNLVTFEFKTFDVNGDITRDSVNCASSLSLDSASPYVEDFIKIQGEIEKIEIAEKTIRSNVSAILEAETTVNRLLKVWPEAKAYIPEPENITNFPAILVDDLNKMIAKSGVV
jgi:hypothetical protein